MNLTRLGLISLPLILTACATSPPSQVNNICSIFSQKPSWYGQAKKSEKRWGSSVPTMMAFMYQESRFVSTARPPRQKILGVIPGPRASSAYGYSQAKDSTWDWYRQKTGNWGASRSDFQDAIDFIGWYNTQTKKINGVSLSDTYSLYLAYHEGHGGFKKKSYNKKQWLIKVAKKVKAQAATYKKQLAGCEGRLKSGGSGFSLWPF